MLQKKKFLSGGGSKKEREIAFSDKARSGLQGDLKLEPLWSANSEGSFRIVEIDFPAQPPTWSKVNSARVFLFCFILTVFLEQTFVFTFPCTYF